MEPNKAPDTAQAVTEAIVAEVSIIEEAQTITSETTIEVASSHRTGVVFKALWEAFKGELWGLCSLMADSRTEVG